MRIANQSGYPLRASRVLVLCSGKHFEAVSFLGLSSLGYRSFLGCKWLSAIVVGGAGVFL